MNPLWNTLLVAGVQAGEPFLGYVDKIGVAFTENLIATGFGAYIALVSAALLARRVTVATAAHARGRRGEPQHDRGRGGAPD